MFLLSVATTWAHELVPPWLAPLRNAAGVGSCGEDDCKPVVGPAHIQHAFDGGYWVDWGGKRFRVVTDNVVLADTPDGRPWLCHGDGVGGESKNIQAWSMYHVARCLILPPGA